MRHLWFEGFTLARNLFSIHSLPPVAYHLSINGTQSGPHTQFDIIGMIRDGALKGDELVWQQGMTGWMPIKNVTDFDGYWPITEEVIAKAENAMLIARSELDRPRPWLRFWARIIDYLWFTVTIWMIIGLALPQSALDWLVRLYFKGAPLDPVILLLFVPVEAWMLSRRGTTLGKALLRVQVCRLDGTLPSYKQAIQRSLLVFVKGFAMGLFLLSLFTMSFSRARLLQRGTTSWDETTELRVEHGEPEVWRYVLLFCAALVMLLGAGVAFSLSPPVMEMIKAMEDLPK